MSKLVMVVDDDDMLLNLVEIMLKRFNVSVVTAPNGETALQVMECTKPDLFVVDVLMPGMSGLEFSRRIRAHPSMAHLPIIIMSARSAQESITAAMANGASAYVSKMNMVSELPAAIQELLNTPTSNLQ